MNSQIPLKNENLVRLLYEATERRDSAAFGDYFDEQGYFWDLSMAKKYSGARITEGIDVYANAFPNIHREIYDLYIAGEEGDKIIVELSLNGTHRGPLVLPVGTIPSSGRDIHVPCCDIITLAAGKVKSYHCYIAWSILLGQLGLSVFNAK